MWRIGALAAAVFLSAQRAALAQPANPVSAPIETVVVTASQKGPAIWHATTESADVAILGVVEPLPDGFAWDKKPLATIVSQSRLVLLPPQIRMGVLSGVWFYLSDSNLLHPPDGKTLESVLDPDIAADLARACDFLHQPQNRYSNDSPVLAAMRLGSDYRHVAYLTTHEPEDSIAALARAHHVRTERIATYDLIPSAEQLLKLSPALTGRCVEAAVQDIAFQSSHVRAAANAWAVGDTSAMMANWSPSHYYACLVQLSPDATSVDARSIDDTVRAIDAAIADGGRTLAVVPIGILLRKDGVLDRLKAERISIAGP